MSWSSGTDLRFNSAMFTDVGMSPATNVLAATAGGKAGMSGGPETGAGGGVGAGAARRQSSVSWSAPPGVGEAARSRGVGGGGRRRGPEFMRTYRCREGGSRGTTGGRTLCDELEGDVTKGVLLEISEERIECREVAMNGPNQRRI